MHWLKDSTRITEAEWPIMDVLWKNGSATAAEIVEAVTTQRDVAMRTVKTLLRRLMAKKAVAYAIDPSDSRVYHYRAIIGRETAIRSKSEHFLANFYKNDINELLNHFIGEATLSDAQIATLQELLAKKRTAVMSESV